VNLTADARAAEAALEKGAVERAMEHVRDPGRAELRGLMARRARAVSLWLCVLRRARCALQVMLLANLTVSPAGAALMLQQGKGVLEGAPPPAADAWLRLTCACAGFHFSYLLHLLAAEPGGWAAHAAHVAANVSNLPAGRALLVAPADGRVVLLARALAAPGAAAAARWGSATALRNCALDEELHGALLAAVGNGASPVVPALLAPLAPAARVAEQAVPLREACADALAALARTEAGRAAMWAAGAVESMRVAYEDEQAPRVCAALEQAVRAVIAVHATACH